MNLEILILIISLGVVILLVSIAFLITLSKNKRLLLEIQRLENLILKHSESNRVIDSIESLLENNEDSEKKLCESIRQITNSNTVIYLEMNKTDGSFKPKTHSSLNEINLGELNIEYVDENSLAIITGSDGTSKVLNKTEDKSFPAWFEEIDFETVISVPIIEGFETIGCIYVFTNNKLETNIDENLKNIWVITNLYLKTKSKIALNNFDNKDLDDSNAISSSKNISKKTISLDENLELLKFKNDEISLSNSEFLIMKKLFDKNGEVLLYQDIENILWPNRSGINKSAMRLHIHRLRDKLNTISKNLDLIKTVRGRGIFLDLNLL